MSDKLPIERDESFAVAETEPILAMIERVATNPDADIEKLERLLDMRERVMDREAEAAFSIAMSAAQQEMGRVSADATNPQTKSTYASYAQLDMHLRPIYTAHGFALSFGTGPCDVPEHLLVTCDVSHIGGHTKHYEIPMPADGKGAKGGDVMTKTHATGAAATYGMRYLLKLIFNVAIGENDMDGNAPVDAVSDEQAANIQAILDELKDPAQAKHGALNFAGVQQISEIPANKYDTVIAGLEKKRRDGK